MSLNKCYKKMTTRSRRTRKKPEGLGDVVENITEATGIKKAVKAIAGDDCGCNERKDLLNKLFPFRRNVQCLEESEQKWVEVVYNRGNKTISFDENKEICRLYNKAFNPKTKKESTSCGVCLKDMLDDLYKLSSTNQ